MQRFPSLQRRVARSAGVVAHKPSSGVSDHPVWWNGDPLCLLFCTVAFAEVIDRIVAVADGWIVTLSDLRQEREMGAIRDKPIDDDPTLARELVDNRRIDRQTPTTRMSTSPMLKSTRMSKAESLELE